MTAPPEPATAAPPAATACYLYGIVPSSAQIEDPPGTGGQITVVPYGRIAALVRMVPADPVLPARRDLLEHAEVLDRTAATTPVLPMRFGTVAPSRQAVQDEVLAPHQEEYGAALEALAGRAQFTVRARYLADRILHEVLAEEPRVLRLHAELRRRGGGYQADRVRLGELVAHAVAARREADAAVLTEALRPHTISTRARLVKGGDPDRIADVACFVELRRRAQLESAAERLGTQWRDRARLRLLGPMAAYDFVGDLTATPAGR